MTQRKWILSGGLSIALSMVGSGMRAAPQTSPQTQTNTQTYTQAEYDASQAARSEKDLDDFVAKYPNSVLLPSVYRAFYLAYWRSNDYPKAILYVDKLLALGNAVEVGTRLEALVARAQAFVVDSRDEVLPTPEAYTSARDMAVEGLRTASEWQKPPDLSDEQFAAQKKSSEIIFNGAAAIAESGLTNPKAEACKSPLVAPPDPGRFDRMINEILQEQRQTPRVR